MKTLIVILASLASLSANAAGNSLISDAEVGQTFALKQDVIFNEGIEGANLYRTTKDGVDTDGKKIQIGLSCGLQRYEDGDCPGFLKTIVHKGKYRVIKKPIGRYMPGVLVLLTATEKKNHCTYSLVFGCSVDRYPLPEIFEKIVKQELNYQASRLVDVQDDATEPHPWP